MSGRQVRLCRAVPVPVCCWPRQLLPQPLAVGIQHFAGHISHHARLHSTTGASVSALHGGPKKLANVLYTGWAGRKSGLFLRVDNFAVLYALNIYVNCAKSIKIQWRRSWLHIFVDKIWKLLTYHGHILLPLTVAKLSTLKTVCFLAHSCMYVFFPYSFACFLYHLLFLRIGPFRFWTGFYIHLYSPVGRSISLHNIKKQ